MSSIAEGHPKFEERIDKDGASYNCTAMAVAKPHLVADKEEEAFVELVKKLKKGKKQPSFPRDKVV